PHTLRQSLCTYLRRLPHAHIYTLFPYTTLFRSCREKPKVRKYSRRTAKDTTSNISPRFPVSWDRYESTSAYRSSIRSTGSEQVSDRKSTRLNSSHGSISYAVFCLKKKRSKNITE